MRLGPDAELGNGEGGQQHGKGDAGQPAARQRHQRQVERGLEHGAEVGAATPRVGAEAGAEPRHGACDGRGRRARREVGL